jgi:mRNA-degrading endonuclease RelE of RelBE toxin-antitoxin system
MFSDFLYKVELYKKARKRFDKLDKATADRLYSAFQKFKEPFKLDIKKMKNKGNFYRIRMGDLRAIVWIDFKNRILYIIDFDFRGRIYDRW